MRRKSVLALALVASSLIVSSSQCFALWSIGQVSTAEAEELGIEIRSRAAGPDAVWVELEFKTESKLQSFSRVDSRIGEGETSMVTATLREDRSMPGRVVVDFTADRAHLGKIALWVMVADSLPGGTIHELRVKDFIEQEKARADAAEQGAGDQRLPRSESRGE